MIDYRAVRSKVFLDLSMQACLPGILVYLELCCLKSQPVSPSSSVLIDLFLRRVGASQPPLVVHSVPQGTSAVEEVGPYDANTWWLNF